MEITAAIVVSDITTPTAAAVSRGEPASALQTVVIRISKSLADPQRRNAGTQRRRQCGNMAGRIRLGHHTVFFRLKDRLP